MIAKISIVLYLLFDNNIIECITTCAEMEAETCLGKQWILPLDSLEHLYTG